MPKTHLCIICAVMTAMFAVLLVLAPSPALTQDEAAGDEDSAAGERADAEALPNAVHVGEDGDSAGQVSLTLKALGSERVLAGFKLLVLVGMDDGENVNHTVATDDDGRLNVILGELPKTLRVFAYGDYVIPEAWSNVPIERLDLAAGDKWELFARPLRRITITGRVDVPDVDIPIERANVAFAPLDVGHDGSERMFDEPVSVLTRSDGTYRVELPTGYYRVWSYWSDRRADDWTYYVKVSDEREFFNDREVNLTLEEGPVFEGRVIDARTGEGIAATIDLYTNRYLRQLRNYSADGDFPDEEIDGEEVYWPVGTFRINVWMVDPNDFTVVIRPSNDNSVLRVIPDFQLESAGDDVTFELFTEDMRTVDLKISTHVHDMPINEIDVNLLPRTLDAPQHLTRSYEASGMTDHSGVASFRGLAPGTYEVYAMHSSMFLGEIDVAHESEQQLYVHLEIPFVYGKVAWPDGEVCKDAVVFVWIRNKAGEDFGPFDNDAYRENPILKEEGRVFVPLSSEGSTVRIRFAAFQKGVDPDDQDWLTIEDFPLVTDEFTVTVNDEKGWEVDMELAPNPDFDPDSDDED